MNRYLKNDVKFNDLIGRPKENKQIYEIFLNDFQNKILEQEEREERFYNNVTEMVVKAFAMVATCIAINEFF